MREIPSLKTLALRAVGPPGCNPEISFGGGGGCRSSCSSDLENDDGAASAIVDDEANDAPSSSSSRKHTKQSPKRSKTKPSSAETSTAAITPTSRLLRSMRNISTQSPRPYIGPGRPNAADVDIAHPWIMAVQKQHHPAPVLVDDGAATVDGGSVGDGDEFLSIENGNLAIETLQLFIDALVESGRAGDGKLGVHFFKEWVVAATGRENFVMVDEDASFVDEGGVSKSNGGNSRSKKRQKTTIVAADEIEDNTANSSPPPLLGALSLHNFSAGSTQTFASMRKANVGYCLGTLDISGVHGLTDSILSEIICGDGSFPHLKRLSVKNCRKLTGKGLASLVKLTNLTALDIGGCFNVLPNDVVSMVRNHPSTKVGNFEELYASGLGWTDAGLEELVDLTVGQLCGLGIGFSPYLSGPGLLLTLSKLASTLHHLAVPFVQGMDDACMSALGKSLRKLAVLDIRGCNKIYSLSGMMEGRSSSSIDDGNLFVLARYSGISSNSLDETMRLYDCKARLTCILDGGGTGGGIRR